jgi:hypothetical protein
MGIAAADKHGIPTENGVEGTDHLNHSGTPRVVADLKPDVFADVLVVGRAFD